MTTRCLDPLGFADIVAYHCGELDDQQQAALEEHAFACDACGDRFAVLSELRRDVALAFYAGQVSVAVPQAFLDAVVAAGLKVRTYDVQDHGTVNCTVAPEDDAIVLRLHAGIVHGETVDLELEVRENESGPPTRHILRDVVTDASRQQIIMASAGATVRSYADGLWKITARAHAPRGTEGRILGSYTLCHRRWPGV